jgi:cystathionine beta-lyase/cystathionine gamma-synthase
MAKKEQKFSTKAVHAGQHPDPTSGAVMTPVYLTSTYAQEALGKNKGYEYSRVSNPTRDALERNIAALENGANGMAFGSGMAAIDAIFRLLKPGDHVVVSHNVYGGTFRIGKLVLEEYGLQFDFVDTTKLDAVRKAIRRNTRMIFVETPTNPTMEITDLSAIAALAKTRKLISVADNTFATPYL